MTTRTLPWLMPDGPVRFPPPAKAMRAPNGLLAMGGDLTPAWLLSAYGHGIFPWFGPEEPILWWSPDPRCVFNTADTLPSHSLRRHLRHCGWTITIDRDFERVMRACAAPRADQDGTWISEDMVRAYVGLHLAGHAHSIEVWDDDRLVGGLYGVAIGCMFAGESMFSATSGGSKAALVCLCALLARWGFPCLDAQVGNPHLYLMGAQDLPRAAFVDALKTLCQRPPATGAFALPQAVPVADFATIHGNDSGPVPKSTDTIGND